MKKFISVLTILCLLLGFSMPIVSAANSWSGWALSGGAVLQGDEIHVISNNASTSIARLNRTAGTKFDLEVEFTVKKFGTQGGFQILTGSNRAMMYIYENRIEYRASNFSATNKLSSISYDIGYTKHKYRIVGNGNQCDLYIDDYFVTDFTIENNTGSSCIYFWTMSAANSTSEIVVEGYRDRGASTQTSSTATDEKTFDTEPKAFRYDFEDGEDISAWQLGGAWEVKDGYLQCRNSTTSSHLAKRVTAFADDYVLEMRVRYPEYGMNSGINLRDGVHELLAHPYEKLLQVRNRLGIVAKTGLSLGNDWHDIKIETYNNGSDVMIFMDGELIHDNTTSDRVEEETYIGVSVTGTDGDTGWMQIDWMTFEPISNSDFGIKTPMQFAEYLEGQEVNLSTNVKDTDNVPYVEYKMNGKTVAKGEAPGYDAVLKNLKQGNYTITAEYGETKSVGVNFKVLPAVLGEIDVDNGKSVSIDLYDERSSVKSVECFADGMSIGTSDKAPFKFDLPELSAEAHMLSAVMYGDDGSIICETAEKMTVLPTETSASVNYANDIVYTLTGTDGSADVDFCNGNHRLHLSHSNGVVTYLTDEGEATYDGGVGVWRVLTDAYTAEVYRDGQFIFSFVMPKTDDVGCYTEENGLSISDLNISVPESRGNYFVKRNVKDINATYNLSNIGYYNNIDFVAGSGDGVELALSDGYFRTSIELKDGKIYTFTTDTDSSVPYRTEIADVSDFDGDVYYRVETAAGMTRLYADGKWLNSFRSVHSTGNGSVGVNVTDGDGLKYVSVNDNADLYVYEDNFTGSGEFDSEDYWRQENLVCYVDKTGGAMTLNAKNETKAISELHVSAQESEMSAEVEVKECTGGFWFIFNHGAENIYSKAGYNFETGNFEITNNLVDDIDTVSVKGDMPIGERIVMSLKVRETDDGKEAVLYVNGNEVISRKDTLENRGRVGFIIDKGVVYLHNFEYTGDSKPVLTVTEQLIDNTSATYDMYEVGDELVLMNQGRKIRSTDGFKTWTVETTFGDTHTSDNIVRLKSGALLSVSRITVDGGYICQSNISYDDGQSWEKQTNIMDTPRQGRITMNNRVLQGPSGRIYFSSGEDNNEAYGAVRLFYSDDDGWTWTASETELNPETTGWSVQEGKVIELSDGEVQMYFRNEGGTLMYFTSHDRGVTWDVNAHKTPFHSTLNCFNVDYDPYNDNELYIAWGYDNAFTDGRDQTRRTRIAMARSRDNGKTWGYLGTVFEFDMNTFFIQRGNDYTMMNACVNVGKDYVVVNAYGRHDLNTSWTNRVVVMEKDKLRETGRFEQVHFLYSGFIDITRFVSEQKIERTLVADKNENNILLNGRIIENGFSDNKISAVYAAALAGAEISRGDDGKVILTSNGIKSEFVGTDTANGVFIPIKDFADEYSLSLCERDDIYIISPYDSWSADQIRTFRYALNLFSENTDEQSKQ